jgi:hypothetical protein
LNPPLFVSGQVSVGSMVQWVRLGLELAKDAAGFLRDQSGTAAAGFPPGQVR